MTDDQKQILAQIVADPDAWYAHAIEYGGQQWADECLAAKVATHETVARAAIAENRPTRVEADRAEEEEYKRKIGFVGEFPRVRLREARAAQAAKAS